MTEKAYNLIEIFLKFSLWPLLAIVALIIFRSQIRAILSNIGGANNVKLNSAVLSFEATTTQSTIATQESDERTDIVESAQNTKKTSALKATGDDWFTEIYDLLTDGKSDEAQEAFDNFIRIKDDSINYAKEHSFFLYLKYKYTLSSDISNQILGSIEQSNEPEKKQFYIDSYISCLQITKQYGKAITFLEKNIEHASSVKNRARLVTRLSAILCENSEQEKAKKIIIELIETLEKDNDDDIEFGLHLAYKKLADIEKNTNNNFNYALCLDKAAEYVPTDTNAMFDAGYEASKVALSSLEVSNYRNLISLETKNSMAYNNIGATSARFKLKIISGSYFKDSEKLNNTLAMANIGSNLLDAGLYDETEELIKKGLASENPHENIHMLATRARNEKESEIKKWKEIQTISHKKQQLIRKYTHAYYCTSEKLLTEKSWIDDKGIKAAVHNVDGELSISWESETDHIEFKGTINNLSSSGIYTSKKNKAQNSLLSFGDKDTIYHCLVFYAPQSEQIFIVSPQADDDFIRVLRKN